LFLHQFQLFQPLFQDQLLLKSQPNLIKTTIPTSYQKGMRLAGKKQKKDAIWYNTLGGTLFGGAFYFLLWQMTHAPK
jgi:hypothetical protein